MTNSRFFFAVGLLSLCNAIAVGAEECEFVFDGIDGHPLVRLTVEPEDGFPCDRLQSVYEFFDGVEFHYSTACCIFIAPEISKPHFSLVRLESYDPLPRVTTTAQHNIASVVHYLRQGLWKKGQLVTSSKISMQPVFIHVDVTEAKIYKGPFEELVEKSGVVLYITIPARQAPRMIIVLFASDNELDRDKQLQEVFDALSRGEQLQPVHLFLQEFYLFELPLGFWETLSASIKNSAPIVKEGAKTIKISAEDPINIVDLFLRRVAFGDPDEPQTTTVKHTRRKLSIGEHEFMKHNTPKKLSSGGRRELHEAQSLESEWWGAAVQLWGMPDFEDAQATTVKGASSKINKETGQGTLRSPSPQAVDRHAEGKSSGPISNLGESKSKKQSPRMPSPQAVDRHAESKSSGPISNSGDSKSKKQKRRSEKKCVVM